MLIIKKPVQSNQRVGYSLEQHRVGFDRHLKLQNKRARKVIKGRRCGAGALKKIKQSVNNNLEQNMQILYLKKTLESLLLTVVLTLLKGVIGQNFDTATSCTELKKSIFEERVGFSFLFPGAPIQYETFDNCQSYTPLIVNGLPAEPMEFPHMARLGHRTVNPASTEWFCGGTLISKRFVLTAAHCLETPQGEINIVRLGELDFDSETENAKPQDYAVEDYIKHPNFTDPELYNDIGLIKLAEDVGFDRYKHPACLPFEDGYQFDFFIATGWGSTGLAQKSSPKLQKVKLRRFADERCRRVIERGYELPQGFDATTQMCVGSNQTKDTCNGDSGGPILVYHKDYPCMYHVMGVTSVGIVCAKPTVPSIYTRVYHYLDWIKETLAK
ncbi:serine protease snake [Scaptodrosophila lebanonensis]|uniref:Serine protease snake n=1 Tax=Drosophila lebanonensis TaxID=7225 RepID=A0A6J2SZI1_DROLE|nr:serine protease snake [Scaptodrosophila lebanonensis]